MAESWPNNPIGVSSFVFASPMNNEALANFAAMRKLGFDLVEVAIQDPLALSAERVRSAAEASGLALAIAGDFTGGRDISHRLPEERQQGLTYLLHCIEFAAQVGAKTVGGPMYSAVGKARLVSAQTRDRQVAWAVEALQMAGDRAAELGIRLAIEPLNRFESDMVNTVEQGLALCDQVGRDNVGLALDTFHMNIEEKHLGAAIRAAGRRIFSFQASENDRGTPGSGHVPWDEVFDALADVGYEGPIIVESFRSDSPAVAAALSLWRPLASSMTDLASDSAQFLRARRRGRA